MQKDAVPRLALLAGVAALFVAACSTGEGPAQRIGAPRAPLNAFGIAAAGTIEVCIDPASPAGLSSRTALVQL